MPQATEKAQNGRLQQIAANRFSTPQDVIAILLQGFVMPYLLRIGEANWATVSSDKRASRT